MKKVLAVLMFVMPGVLGAMTDATDYTTLSNDDLLDALIEHVSTGMVDLTKSITEDELLKAVHIRFKKKFACDWKKLWAHSCPTIVRSGMQLNGFLQKRRSVVTTASNGYSCLFVAYDDGCIDIFDLNDMDKEPLGFNLGTHIVALGMVKSDLAIAYSGFNGPHDVVYIVDWTDKGVIKITANIADVGCFAGQDRIICSKQAMLFGDLFGNLKYWCIGQGEPITLVLFNYPIIAMSYIDRYSDGSKLVIGCSNGTVSVFDTKERTVIKTLNVKSPDGKLCSLVNLDGDLIAVGYSHGVTKLWNLKDGTYLREFKEATSIKGLSYHVTGNLNKLRHCLVVVTIDGCLGLWDLGFSDSPLQFALTATLGKNSTKSAIHHDWMQLLQDLPKKRREQFKKYLT